MVSNNSGEVSTEDEMSDIAGATVRGEFGRVGLVLGHEDEGRVWVAWGDCGHAENPWDEARVEWVDNLVVSR